MKRTSLSTAVLTASLFAAFASSAQAAETPARYRVRAEATQTHQLQVTRSGSTWFEGTTSGGERVTVVFQPRFTTVKRDGERVPVSFLRAGDRVEARGHLSGRRLHASSAEQQSTQTAAVQLTSAMAAAASCCADGCGEECKACCTATASAAASVTAPSPKDGYRMPPTGARAAAVGCCGAKNAAASATAPLSGTKPGAMACCGASARGCCA